MEKTDTNCFPMKYLSEFELADRGDRYGVVTKNVDGLPSILDLIWMSREF